jgi:hypothetical protein
MDMSESRNSTPNPRKRSLAMGNILQHYPSAAKPHLHQALQGKQSGETRAEAVRRFSAEEFVAALIRHFLVRTSYPRAELQRGNLVLFALGYGGLPFRTWISVSHPPKSGREEKERSASLCMSMIRKGQAFIT